MTSDHNETYATHRNSCSLRCENCAAWLEWEFRDGYDFEAWQAHWRAAGWLLGRVRGRHGWIHESWLCPACVADGSLLVEEIVSWTPAEAEAQRETLALRFPRVGFTAGRLFDGRPCVFYQHIRPDRSGLSGPVTPSRLDASEREFRELHGGQASLFDEVAS